MYSGEADPASPAKTSAASPGASFKRRKVRMMMARSTGIA
jgi:hypothetical protein